MASETRRRWRAPTLGAALALSFAALAPRADAEQPPPNVKRVCVPAADGRTWECGTADDPPAPRALPPPEQRPSTAQPPPFFLANPDAPVASAAEPVASDAAPEAPRTDDFPEVERVVPAAESGADASGATVTAVEDAPAATPVESAQAPAPDAPVDAVATTSDTPSDTTSDMTSDAPTESAPIEASAPVAEPVGESATNADAAATDPIATTDTTAASTEPPAPIDPVVDAPATTTEDVGPVAPLAGEASTSPATTDEAATTTATPTPADTAPPAPSPVDPTRQPLGIEAFARLDGRHQTVQLARAASPDGFSALAQSLGIAPESTYAVPFALNGATVWLLLWGDFPDVASARAAADALSRDHGVGGVYVRRAGPIQSELRGRR